MRPLAGIVVMAVEQAVAAPICTRHLGDLGARVIKVENRAGGDFARGYDDYVKGMSAYFARANRNKESVALDLKHPLGRDVLARLVAKADVVVQNLAPGAAARLGLAPDQLLAARPGLIAVAISGYGTGGPYEGARAYDLLAQSEAGACAITGIDGEPAKPGIPIADIGAGLYALSSVLAALFVRMRTGEGAAIEVGLFDVVAEWMGYALNVARYGGFDLEPNGVSSPAVAPYGAYRTADGQTLVLGTTNDREWLRLARDVLGRTFGQTLAVLTRAAAGPRQGRRAAGREATGTRHRGRAHHGGGTRRPDRGRRPPLPVFHAPGTGPARDRRACGAPGRARAAAS
jgi:crotonobetainyl-CoA:carnitine CoA-transferase CaiB-like acyl-CoA transferase